jgi:hypothetical protein
VTPGRDFASFERLCSTLVKEPFFLTPREIGELSPAQVRFVYGRTDQDDQEQREQHARRQGESGVVGRRLTFKQAFWHLHREGKGLSEEDTQKAWDAHVEAHPQLKAELERQNRLREQARVMAEQARQRFAERQQRQRSKDNL